MFCCCAAEEEGLVAVISPVGVLNEKGATKEHHVTYVPAVLQQHEVEPEEPEEHHAEIPAPAPEPVKPPKELKAFTMTITRASVDAPWGLMLDLSGGSLIHVSGVKSTVGSPVLTYNAEVPEDLQMREGDYIVGVNDILADTPLVGHNTVAEALGEEMKKSTTVTLHMKRPHVFTAEVNKNGDPMGLDLNYSNHCSALAIVKVGDGAVKKSAPEIQAGDRIIAVNGKTGSPDDLLRGIKASDRPVVTLSRPCD